MQANAEALLHDSGLSPGSPFPKRESLHSVAVGHAETGHPVEDLIRYQTRRGKERVMLLDTRVSILPKHQPSRAHVRHYKRDSFAIDSGMVGAVAAGVALDQVMLTYFCVEPYTRWPKHSHESEQITMVLRGELYVELGNDVVTVKEHEAIAIPSYVAHAVFTRFECAEAVDAWSPVMTHYLPGSLAGGQP